MKPSELLPVLAPVGAHFGALVLVTDVAEGLGVGFVTREEPDRLIGTEMLRRLDLAAEDLLMLALANMGGALAEIEVEQLDRDVLRLSIGKGSGLPKSIVGTLALRTDFHRLIASKVARGWPKFLLGIPRRDVLLVGSSEARLKPWVERFYLADLPGRLMRDVLDVEAGGKRVALKVAARGAHSVECRLQH